MTRISDLPAAESIEDDDILLLKKANGGDRRITVAELLGQVTTPTFSDSSALRLLARTTVGTAVANVDFSVVYPDYRHFKVFVDGLRPATDTAAVYLRFSDDGGVTFKSGASDYISHLQTSPMDSVSGGVAAGSTNSAQILLSEATTVGLDNTAAASSAAYEIMIFSPAETLRHKAVRFTGLHSRGDAAASGWNKIDGAAVFKSSTNAINALRFLMSTGNIESGTFSLYGVV